MAELNTAESHKKGPKKVRGKKMSTRIDMTPMVDLAFLLVTFFIFTSSFSKPKIMEVVVPDKKDTTKTKVDKRTVITIIVGNDNKLFYYKGLPDSANAMNIQNTDFSTNGIRRLLIDFDSTVRIYQRNLYPDKPPKGAVVLIKPLPTSKYSSLVSLIDEMKITHVGTYALMDITPSELKMVSP